ncbi:hypothetical protein FBU31_007522, partial [Coemansia sp. 'formosensis']
LAAHCWRLWRWLSGDPGRLGRRALEPGLHRASVPLARHLSTVAQSKKPQSMLCCHCRLQK